MDAVVGEVVADFGPWRWRLFTTREAMADAVVADPILSGLAPFDEEATVHVIAAIPQTRWDQLRDAWGPDVWTVAANPDLRRVSVFVHTQAQVAEVAQTPRWHGWERELRDVITESDEFGSTAVIPVQIALESRESFESDYQGNWSYYWY